MSTKTDKTIEQLKTEIIGLKIKLRRIEDFLREFPIVDDYIPDITEDELFYKAAEIILEYDKVSASLLQRRLSLGYARAARLIDILEEMDLIGPQVGSSPREVHKDNLKKYLQNKPTE